jgi:hypothetical protein
MKLIELVENSQLLEHVRKVGNKFFIFSHRTGKRIGKKEGYGSKTSAVRSMLQLASHGGFSKNKHKSSVIKKYLARHGGKK